MTRRPQAGAPGLRWIDAATAAPGEGLASGSLIGMASRPTASHLIAQLIAQRGHGSEGEAFAARSLGGPAANPSSSWGADCTIEVTHVARR
jgi:hypothetical protein